MMELFEETQKMGVGSTKLASLWWSSTYADEIKGRHDDQV